MYFKSHAVILKVMQLWNDPFPHPSSSLKSHGSKPHSCSCYNSVGCNTIEKWAKNMPQVILHTLLTPQHDFLCG